MMPKMQCGEKNKVHFGHIRGADSLKPNSFSRKFNQLDSKAVNNITQKNVH